MEDRYIRGRKLGFSGVAPERPGGERNERDERTGRRCGRQNHGNIDGFLVIERDLPA